MRVEFYKDGQLIEVVDDGLPSLAEPDWDKLVSLLYNSPEWMRVYSASERTLKANSAFTMLMQTLSYLRKLETLIFAIAKMRESMANITGVGDFTAEEIASINQKLIDCYFPEAVFLH